MIDQLKKQLLADRVRSKEIVQKWYASYDKLSQENTQLRQSLMDLSAKQQRFDDTLHQTQQTSERRAREHDDTQSELELLHERYRTSQHTTLQLQGTIDQ